MTRSFKMLSEFYSRKQSLVIMLVEKALLFNICAFILFSPFSAVFSKISFFWSVVFWISLNILEYKSRFYLYLIPGTALNKSLFLFLAAAFISVLFSVNLYHSQEIFFQRYLFYAIFFWISYDAVSRSRRNIFYFVFSIFVLGLVLGIGGLVDYFRFYPDRLFTVFSKDLDLFVYLCLLFSFNFIVFLSQVRKSFKVLSLVNIVLLYPVLVLNASRVVWVSIIPVILVICFLKNKRIFFYSLMIVIATPFFMPNVQKDRLKTFLYVFEPVISDKQYNSFAELKDSLVERDGSVRERIVLVQSAITMVIKKPIFGSGPGMFEILHRLRNKGSRHLHVHVMCLEILAEMGSVGLLAFFIILFIFFKKFIYHFKSWLANNSFENAVFFGAGLAVFVVLLLNLGVSSILVGFQDALLLWFFMAIVVNEKIFYKNVS